MPNLENIILTNNKITDFEEITNLKNCTKLERLSLINNPITSVIYFLKGTKLQIISYCVNSQFKIFGFLENL